MDRPLVITEDTNLLDAILRVTATTGLEVHVVAFPEAARGPWHLAPIVIVGADLADGVARLGLPRRSDVIVVAHVGDVGHKPPEALWPTALALGAEHVAALPEGEKWLIGRLRAIHDGPSRGGRVLAVLGACGGAGASTLAAGLARAARSAGRRVLLMDGDPDSPGIDLLLGAETVSGVRWPELEHATGRLSPQTLENALPMVDGVVVIAPDPKARAKLTTEVVASVLDAGVRGFDDVIVDLPRTLDSVGELVCQTAQRTFLVVPNRVLATCTAQVVLRHLGDRIGNLAPVIREHRTGLDIQVMADALDSPIAGVVPHRGHVADAAEHGDPPDCNEEFNRACRALLDADVGAAAA